MAARPESQYPQDWFRIAGEDLRRVAKRLAERDADDAAFRLQQAVEKYLKGYLLSKGWTLRRIHDVEELLNDAQRYEPQFERYRVLCQRIVGYYFVERYPMFEEGPSLAEVRQAYTEAKEFIQHLQRGARRRRGQRR